MPRFRRKPTEIEAVQFTGKDPIPPGVMHAKGRYGFPGAYYVVTLHNQRVYLEPGDWIAPEPDGVHYYPIKDAVFQATYEPVEEEEEPAAVLTVVAPGTEQNIA